MIKPRTLRLDSDEVEKIHHQHLKDEMENSSHQNSNYIGIVSPQENPKQSGQKKMKHAMNKYKIEQQFIKVMKNSEDMKQKKKAQKNKEENFQQKLYKLGDISEESIVKFKPIELEGDVLNEHIEGLQNMVNYALGTQNKKIDRKFNFYKRSLNRIYRSLQEYLQKLKDLEHKLINHKSMKDLVRDLQNYQGFANQLQYDIHLIEQEITIENVKKEKLYNVIKSLVEKLRKKQNNNLQMTTQITELQKKINNHQKEIKKQEYLNSKSHRYQTQEYETSLITYGKDMITKMENSIATMKVPKASSKKYFHNHYSRKLPWSEESFLDVYERKKKKEEIIKEIKEQQMIESQKIYKNLQQNEIQKNENILDEIEEYQNQPIFIKNYENQNQIEQKNQQQKQEKEKIQENKESQQEQNENDKTISLNNSRDSYLNPDNLNQEQDKQSKKNNEQQQQIQKQQSSNYNQFQLIESEYNLDNNNKIDYIIQNDKTLFNNNESSIIQTNINYLPNINNTNNGNNATSLNNNQWNKYLQEESPQEKQYRQLQEEILHFKNKNENCKQKLIKESSQFFDQLKLLDESIIAEKKYLEKLEKIVLKKEGLNGSFLFELKKQDNELNQFNKTLENQNKIKKTNLMARQINSLMHDTLQGMIDKRAHLQKVQDSTSKIFVDWETFNTLTPIQLCGIITMKPQVFEDLKKIMQLKGVQIQHQLKKNKIFQGCSIKIPESINQKEEQNKFHTSYFQKSNIIPEYEKVPQTLKNYQKPGPSTRSKNLLVKSHNISRSTSNLIQKSKGINLQLSANMNTSILKSHITSHRYNNSSNNLTEIFKNPNKLSQDSILQNNTQSILQQDQQNLSILQKEQLRFL